MGRVIAFVGSCILLAACGGRSTHTAPEQANGGKTAVEDAGAVPSIDDVINRPASPEEIAEACDALARAMCARREDCASPSTFTARHVSEDDCRARTKLACTDWGLLPHTQITPRTIAPCVDTIRTASCRDIDTLFYTPTGNLPYCLPSGNLPSSAPCVNDAQCESRYCGPQWDDFGGNGLERDCLECTAGGPWDILQRGYDGDACEDQDDCVEYLTCEAGHCTRLECEGESCLDEGAYCPIDDSPYCELGTDCSPNYQSGEGTCLVYAKDGEPCGVDDDYGPVCEYPATCVRGICRLSHERDCPKATTLTDQIGPR